MEGSHRHHLHQYQQQQQQQHQLLQPRHGRPTAQSRLVALKDTVGEIVEVEGGHIVRSTGRKDRHSKVFTAKGPRDRRVRLSAHTAIQFYDVQDRLGYDRPSKAVDWLIKNAKAAIDELAELPPWNPTDQSPPPLQQEEATHEPPGGPTRKRLPESDPVASSPAFVFGAGNFLPPSLDSDSIADTIKYFFPVSAATGGASIPGGGFQSYPSVDILQRGGSQAQDLRLSLQSFQEPILLHHPQQPPATAEQSPFTSSSSTALAFDGSSPGWPDLNQRAFSWNGPAENGGAGSGGGGGGGGFIFSVPPPQAVPLHPVLGQGQFLTQRGPLQSIASPHVRAWTDAAAVLQPAPSFAAAAGGFSGFRVPARIQGEEEHDGIPRKPSSTSSASRH